MKTEEDVEIVLGAKEIEIHTEKDREVEGEWKKGKGKIEENSKKQKLTKGRKQYGIPRGSQ